MYRVILFLILSSTSTFAQHIVSVKRAMNVHLFIPNPIEIAKFGVQASDVVLKPINGKIDTVNDIVYWTPLATNASLIMSIMEGGIKKPVDTIRARIHPIDPKEFQVRVDPVTLHGAFPDLKRFKALIPSWKFGDFAHINMDTVAQVTAFTVEKYDKDLQPLSSFSFNASMSEGEIDRLRKYIWSTKPNESVFFSNIYVRCSCWRGKDGSILPSLLIGDELWAGKKATLR